MRVEDDRGRTRKNEEERGRTRRVKDDRVGTRRREGPVNLVQDQWVTFSWWSRFEGSLTEGDDVQAWRNERYPAELVELVELLNLEPLEQHQSNRLFQFRRAISCDSEDVDLEML